MDLRMPMAAVSSGKKMRLSTIAAAVP
jgi:hypothetical protein